MAEVNTSRGKQSVRLYQGSAFIALGDALSLVSDETELAGIEIVTVLGWGQCVRRADLVSTLQGAYPALAAKLNQL